MAMIRVYAARGINADPERGEQDEIYLPGVRDERMG